MNTTILGLALFLGLALYFGYNNWMQQEDRPTRRPTPKLPTKNGKTQYGLDCTKTEDGPCQLDDTSIRFWIIGDWGGQTKAPFTTVAQLQCAALMDKKSKQKAPQFFVSVGDNIYDHGVRSVTDPRWQAAWDNVFLYGKKERLPWYATMGNHDYFGNAQAQVDYSFKNNRWVCDYNYMVSYKARPKGPSADFIFIDTVIMCGNTPEKKKERGLGDGDNDDDEEAPFKAKYTAPADPAAAQHIWEWLEEKLAKSRADYLFVAGHYPAFGAVTIVSRCLVPRLQDLMEKYHVTAYLSGHEHSLQHLTTKSRVSGAPIHHVISGGAHKFIPNFKPHFEGTKAWNKWEADYLFYYPMPGVLPNNMTQSTEHGGVAYAELKSDFGYVQYYDCTGKMHRSVPFKPRRLP